MHPATHADPDDLAKIAAIDFARHLVRQWQGELAAQLLGAYLIGSLAHSGFSRRYSDIDIALVTAAGLDPQALDHLRSEAAALSTDWGAKVSIFWTDRHFSLGRFPPLDRIDYLDHRVTLTERECVRPARPTREEIQHYLRGAPFANWADRARSLAAATALESKDHKAYLRTLLYPARFFYTWMTGLMGSNDDAVEFLRGRRPEGFNVGLVERALQCRWSAADPAALFTDRALIPSQIDACVMLLTRAST